MSESTRPSGALNGDGGIDGSSAGPVPPPSRAGGAGLAAVFASLLDARGDGALLRGALRRRSDLRVPYGLLLVCGPDCDPPALGRVIAGRVPRGIAVCCSDASPRHAAVVVPAPSGALWAHAVDVARTEAAARCGLVVPRAPVLGLRALRAAYFAALADAGLAVALDLSGPVVAEADLVVPRMLAALPAADQETLLHPLCPILCLAAPQRSAYVRTLDALHRHGGTCAGAAAVLHVHPNTVRYRMDRIEEMTGLRLDDPHDRLRIDLAATLVVLRGWPPDLQPDFGLSFRERPVVDFQSEQLAGVLPRRDGEVRAQGDQEVAAAQGDHLGKHRRADQGLGAGRLHGGELGVDGQAFAVAATGLGEARRRAVATPGIARLERVVPVATDLADLDSAGEAVPSHVASFPLTTGGRTSVAGQRATRAGGSGAARVVGVAARAVDIVPRL